LRQQLKRVENCAQQDDSRLTMKSQLIAIVAAVLVVGCGESAPDISINKAARTGNIEAVKQHIAAGTDVNSKDKGKWGGGTAPLHWAATKEIAELLISKSADVNAKANDGWTPLHWAADKGHKEIVELLIAAGADVNARSRWGGTPSRKHPEIADLLRKHGGKTGEELKAERE
jgi:ankyrin repeat protein